MARGPESEAGGVVRAIGIDLGTTYTVVATIAGGRPHVLCNAEGAALTPSVVAFSGAGAPMVGQAAKLGSQNAPEQTVFSIKRRMGSDFRVRVREREYTPEQISGLILRKVTADAEARLGERLEQAVITVPAYFNDRQRQATREAGRLAGLDVLRIINEPTAAALAYGLNREDAQTVLVWDLGGGTFDVSILELGEGIFEVRAVAGDSWLGGDDFDRQLAGYLAAQYRRAYGEDFPADCGAQQALCAAAEQAKIRLSSAAATRVFLPSPGTAQRAEARTTNRANPWGRRHLDVVVTREQLEHVTQDLLGRLVAPTEQAFADAGLAPQDVDRVILVGGSTRMPAARALIRRLTGREPYRYVDPDEAVARGAAIQAGMLLGLIEKAVLLDVLPLSLGVETQGELVAQLIPRNTPLPASGAQVFTTAADGQTRMDIHVLQGERALAKDNVSLGQLHLTDIPAAPRGVANVEVAFDADVDGIVHVTAKDLLSEREIQVQVAATKLLDAQEIDHLADDAVRYAEQDRQQREQVQARVAADSAVAAAELVLRELAGTAVSTQVHPVVAAVQRVREALAGGAVEEIRHCSEELRRQLGRMHETRGVQLNAPTDQARPQEGAQHGAGRHATDRSSSGRGAAQGRRPRYRPARPARHGARGGPGR